MSDPSSNLAIKPGSPDAYPADFTSALLQYVQELRNSLPVLIIELLSIST